MRETNAFNTPADREAARNDLLSLTPRERAVLVSLGTQAGEFGTGQAKDARDHAAEVAELIHDQTFVTTGEGQPPQKFTRR